MSLRSRGDSHATSGLSRIVGRAALVTSAMLTVMVAAAAPAGAQSPDTDIYLAPLQRDGGLLRMGEPANITARAGYDNQPHFAAAADLLWYTRIDETGQADIWSYRSGVHGNVTGTAPESEYSATPLPTGDGISVIRVERDSSQRLWRFDADGANARVVFENVAPVGYHAWADENRVAMFILGQPATLQLGDVRTGEARLIASDIGRAIQKVPGRVAVSFLHLAPSASSSEAPQPMLRMLDVESGELTDLAAPPGITVEGRNGPTRLPAEYHAWLPDGTLITAAGSVLYALEAGQWRPFADLSAAGITISRLAIDPHGSRIAFVGEIR